MIDGVVKRRSEFDNFNGNSKIVEPTVRMIFHSEEDIKSFYKKYSNDVGFRWKIRDSKKGDDG